MKRKLLALVVILSAFCLMGGCVTLSEEARAEYGHLKSAIEASAYAINGEYGEAIPPGFNFLMFMKVVKGKIPEQYYKTLGKYPITVQSKGSYYLLIAANPDTKTMILFDYSCTPQADGLVYLYPQKYDTNNLDQYDPCKKVK
jgi:hypothetical protein